jgi:hypothetical protein
MWKRWTRTIPVIVMDPPFLRFFELLRSSPGLKALLCVV